MLSIIFPLILIKSNSFLRCSITIDKHDSTLSSIYSQGLNKEYPYLSTSFCNTYVKTKNGNLYEIICLFDGSESIYKENGSLIHFGMSEYEGRNKVVQFLNLNLKRELKKKLERLSLPLLEPLEKYAMSMKEIIWTTFMEMDLLILQEYKELFLQGVKGVMGSYAAVAIIDYSRSCISVAHNGLCKILLTDADGEFSYISTDHTVKADIDRLSSMAHDHMPSVNQKWVIDNTFSCPRGFGFYRPVEVASLISALKKQEKAKVYESYYKQKAITADPSIFIFNYNSGFFGYLMLGSTDAWEAKKDKYIFVTSEFLKNGNIKAFADLLIKENRSRGINTPLHFLVKSLGEVMRKENINSKLFSPFYEQKPSDSVSTEHVSDDLCSCLPSA